MESLKPNVVLEFNKDQLYNVRKVYNYDIVSRLVQDIDLFEDWIAKQNHFRVKKFDREYLERYLIYNKGSVERAKKHFDNFCSSKNLMPEFLQNFELSQFEPLRSCTKAFLMPKPTPDNYRVGIVNLHGNNEKMDIALLYKYAVMCLEYTMHHDYCLGWHIIMDTREMPYSMLTKLNPNIIAKALTLITETMGQRLKSFHFLSGSKFIDTIVSLFKQAMSQKLANRIQIHDTMESLQKTVGKEYLPSDYGGDGKSVEELDETFYKILSGEEHAARMKFMESASTNELCRLITNNSDGMAGSFKTLAID